MDERRISELFQSAADQAADSAPPAGFDHADVLAGSRRATVRYRRRVTAAQWPTRSSAPTRCAPQSAPAAADVVRCGGSAA